MSQIMNDISKASFGQFGGVAMVAATTYTAPAGMVIALVIPTEDLVVASQVNAADVTNPVLSAIPVHQAGIPIAGRYTSITLTSGKALAYYLGV